MARRPSAEGPDRLSEAARAGTHVTTNDLCNLAESAGFWCGRRGSISNRRAWKARADALCVAPAPRDGAGNGRSEHRRCPQKWWKCLTS